MNPVFMSAEWLPPGDENEFCVCDVCSTPTQDLVIMRTERAHVGVCNDCVRNLSTFMETVLDRNNRLNYQWTVSGGNLPL